MKLITLTGASACGKDSLLNKVLKSNKNIKPIISVTTRPKREGEEDGVEYKFISLEELTELYNNEELIEIREYHTEHGVWYYGITKDSIDVDSDDIYIVIVDVQGVVQLRQYLYSLESDNIKVESVFINCNGKERMLRSLTREPNLNDNQVAEICRRYLDDLVNVGAYKEAFDIILRNELPQDIDRCVSIINSLAQTESNEICAEPKEEEVKEENNTF